MQQILTCIVLLLAQWNKSRDVRSRVFSRPL